MKTKLFICSLLFLPVSFSQVQLLSKSSFELDSEQLPQPYDSVAYMYDNNGNFITSNRPSLVWDGAAVMYMPVLAIDFYEKNQHQAYGSWDTELVSSETATYNAEGKMSTSEGTRDNASFRYEYAYGSNGKLSTTEYFYNNLINRKWTYSYNTDDQIVRYVGESYDQNGIVIYANMDSTFYDGLLVKSQKTYTGNDVNSLELSGEVVSTISDGKYLDSKDYTDDNGSMVYTTHIDYTYVQNKMKEIKAYNVNDNVPDPTYFFNSINTYSGENLIDSDSYFEGSLFETVKYEYIADGFVSSVSSYNVDNGEESLFGKRTYKYSGSLGLKEVSSTEGVLVYPNPSSKFLEIKSDSDYTQLDIINSKGEIVRSVKGKVEQINIEELSAGVYSVNLSSETGVVHASFVKL
jgi:hypothetical protein